MKKTKSILIPLIILALSVFALTACNNKSNATPTCEHRDADDNLLCDECGKEYSDGIDVESGL